MNSLFKVFPWAKAKAVELISSLSFIGFFFFFFQDNQMLQAPKPLLVSQDLQIDSNYNELLDQYF